MRVLIVLNWTVGVLIAALLTISIVAPDLTWRGLGVGASGGHAGVVALMRVIMVIGIVGTPISHILLSRLLRIVESVRAGETFTMANAVRLRTIAWALLGLELLHLGVVGIASVLAARGVRLSVEDTFRPIEWLAILLLFVLAQVFVEGMRMREDLEGVV